MAIMPPPPALDAPMAAWAQYYVENDWPVFPCKGKQPLVHGGFHAATTDPFQIEIWWREWPHANIGTPMSAQRYALDVDPRRGGDDSLYVLEKQHGPLPRTLTCHTGGGGFHKYLWAPEGVTIVNKAYVGDGIDVQGPGSYVILPPSIHPVSGKPYVWDIEDSPDDIAPQRAPTWLETLVTAHAAANGKHKPVAEPGATIPDGMRENTLVRLAGGMRACGASVEEIRASLELMNQRCAPPLPGADLDRIAKSMGRYDPDPIMSVGRPTPQGGPLPANAWATPPHVWPDPLALPEGLPAVRSFDFMMLPETLRPWAQDMCERMQCPPDFVAVAIMVALGSVLGRKLGIRPQARTNWIVIANQWAMAIGRPGVLKSPALEAALAPVKRLQARAAEQYQSALEAYRQALKLTKLRSEASEKAARKKLAHNPQADVSADLRLEEPEEPMMPRYLANDTTAAALGELLRQNPNGLLVFRDELVSLLRSLDREDQAEARGFYLTAWNGDSAYTFDRIGRGFFLHIPAVCLSVLGSTQPGRIAEYLREAVRGGKGDDGLMQRFGLLVWPDTSGPWREVDRWPDSAARQAAYEVFTRLAHLTPEDVGAQRDEDEAVPYLRFDPPALELFRTWREQLETLLRSTKLHPALEAHFAKYRKLIPGLALLCHIADGHGEAVGEEAMLLALSWAEYLESHAHRAYASVMHADLKAAHAILDKLRRGELPHTFAAREIYRQGWAQLSDRTQVQEALQVLVARDYLAELTIATSGRSKHTYQVNPKALA